MSDAHPLSAAVAVAVGIDIGGTHLKAVLIDALGNILNQTQADTLDSPAGLIAGVQAVLREWSVPVSMPLGIACPGLASPDARSIAHMPGRMQSVVGLDFTSALGRSTFVLNDAHAATLGEHGFGSAKGRRSVLMLTLGTGVGGGIVLDGRLVRGSSGRAGHLGHMTINHAGPRDITGTPGSIEDAIGNHTITQRSAGRFTSTQALIEAIRQGDAHASAVWQHSVDALAAHIVSLINALDPQAIVIGGGIASAGELLFARLREAMSRIEWKPMGVVVDVVPAMLGSCAGAVGAARFALSPECRG